MDSSVALQVLSSIAIPLAAVWLTVRATSRETVRAIRTEALAQRLIALADSLAGASRDLRDQLFAGDACASCGAGVQPRHLHEVATRIDRVVDLALVHVRDERLRASLVRVVRTAGDVTRHRRSLSAPCDELLSATYALVAACDQVAEQCLNLLHDGRAVVPPQARQLLSKRIATALRL